MVYTYIYNEILFSFEQEGKLVICNNIDETGGYSTKWNKTEREKKYCMVESEKKFPGHRNRK